MKSVLVFQIEDRNDDRFNNFMNENKQTCLNNQMQYLFMKKTSFDVPIFWGKIMEIKRILTEQPNLNYLMWLDSDAFFYEFSIEKLQNFLKKYENYSMIISKDMPPWEKGNFNAGSFFIKNDKVAHKILDKWITYYHPDRWEYKDSKWTTDGEWAKDDYEQGSFEKFILPEFKQNIKQLPYYILNNNSCEENTNDTISVHLASHFKNDKKVVNKCISKFKYVYINWYKMFVWSSIILIILFAFYIIFYKYTNITKYFKRIIKGYFPRKNFS